MMIKIVYRLLKAISFGGRQVVDDVDGRHMQGACRYGRKGIERPFVYRFLQQNLKNLLAKP